MACGVLAAVGGPLLGVLIARWWRWPTAAAVTCVLLILWSVSSLAPDKHWLLTLHHAATPFTLVASNGEDWSWHIGGSWPWRVALPRRACACSRRSAPAPTAPRERSDAGWRGPPPWSRSSPPGACCSPPSPARRATTAGTTGEGPAVAELGAVRWGPVAGALAAAAALAVLDLTVWPRGPGSELGALVAGLLGGSAALALDDPAAGVTRAVPTTAPAAYGDPAGGRGRGRRWRGACTSRGRPTRMRADGLLASWLTLVVIGSGVVALCVGVACALGRAGDGQPGTMVASTAVLGMLGLMVLPLPGELAAFDVSSRWTDATGLWGLLGAGRGRGAVLGRFRPVAPDGPSAVPDNPAGRGSASAYFGVTLGGNSEESPVTTADVRHEVSEREAREVAEAARADRVDPAELRQGALPGPVRPRPDPPAPAAPSRRRGARRGVPDRARASLRDRSTAGGSSGRPRIPDEDVDGAGRSSASSG